MLKKYVSKFAMDILPSVAATIIGAYIVNHYIATKPAANAPVAAAVSPVDPKKADTRNDAKPAAPAAELANIPEPGIKAKGISEKAMIEKTAAEKPVAVEKPSEKPVEKSVDKPAETASIPAEPRRRAPPPLREKAIAKVVPAPIVPAIAAPAVAPPNAAPPNAAPPNAAPPVEAAIAPDDHRDANDLARAAIERLRGEGSPRPQETARNPDPPRISDGPRVPDSPRIAAAPPVRPLPPPIMVSTPGTGALDSTAGAASKPPYDAARIGDSGRPTPPADIPIPEASRPLDLRAEAAEPPPRREHTSVAEDVLSAAKSVFHAVLPK
jgi:hypothetical protein